LAVLGKHKVPKIYSVWIIISRAGYSAWSSS